jgi:hypothetical protein
MSKSTVKLAILVIGLISGFLLATDVYAQTGQPASKATAKVSSFVLLDRQTEQSWTTILSNTIKSPSQKDLFIHVSLECGLYAQNMVKSKGGGKDTSISDAFIKVRVLMDGYPAEPGEVVFAEGTQTLSATLEGMIGNALTLDVSGNFVLDEDYLTEEEIGLIQNTTRANSFSFVKADLESGVHTIKVQAMIGSTSKSINGSSSASALVGKGSVTVEQVRMIKNEDIVFEN